MKRRIIIAILLVLVSCSPKAYVTVVRMGPVLAPKTADCKVVFLNDAQHVIMMNGFVYIGMLQVSGHHEEMAKLTDEIPAFLRTATCELGGSAISLNAAASTASQTVIQIIVWAQKTGDTPAKTDNYELKREM